jgi:hypothetical protein
MSCRMRSVLACTHRMQYAPTCILGTVRMRHEICIYRYVFMYKCIHDTYIDTYIHTYIHTYILHTYIYMYHPFALGHFSFIDGGSTHAE